jgi:hypothetical protein
LQDVSPALVPRPANAGHSEQDFATSGLKSWATGRVGSGPSSEGNRGPGRWEVVDAAFVFGQSARDCGIPAGSDESLVRTFHIRLPAAAVTVDSSVVAAAQVRFRWLFACSLVLVRLDGDVDGAARRPAGDVASLARMTVLCAACLAYGTWEARATTGLPRAIWIGPCRAGRTSLDRRTGLLLRSASRPAAKGNMRARGHCFHSRRTSSDQQ